MNELRLVVPMVPPSANHYKHYRVVVPKHGGKPFVQWYHTEMAEAWFNMVAAVASGRKIRGTSYELQLLVFMPTARDTDLDNLFKVVADGLQHAGVIDNDKHITDLHGHRRLDRLNPRTVIVIRTNQEQMFQKEPSCAASENAP
jgi:Holliday junction resolvase RusA-like endonuclease